MFVQPTFSIVKHYAQIAIMISIFKKWSQIMEKKTRVEYFIETVKNVFIS